MTDALTNLDDHSLWLAAVVAGLGALGWLLRKAWRAIRWTRRQYKEWAARFAAIERLVHHELRPNSGTSVKDSLARIEGRGLMTAGMLAQHVQESRAYLAATAEVLAEHGIDLPTQPPPPHFDIEEPDHDDT